MKKLLFVLFILSSSIAVAQQSQQFDQLDRLQTVKPKKVVVFIHTSWCRYCQGMNEVVFKNASIARLLTGQYYFIRLDAEERGTLKFNHHDYNFMANKGYNELAIALGTIKGKLSFPTICILNEKNEILYQQGQFINAEDFLRLLQHFKEL